MRVVAHLRAMEGLGTELGDLLQSLVEPTRAEPGNVSYEVLASLDDERDFTNVEEFRDSDALDAHFRTPHMQAAQARLAELLDGKPDIRRYRRVG